MLIQIISCVVKALCVKSLGVFTKHIWRKDSEVCVYIYIKILNSPNLVHRSLRDWSVKWSGDVQ